MGDTINQVNEALRKVSLVDMTIPAAISFGCASIAVATHLWPLFIISWIIDIMVAAVASVKIMDWATNS